MKTPRLMACISLPSVCFVVSVGKSKQNATTCGQNAILARQHAKQKFRMSVGFATLGKVISMRMTGPCKMANTICQVFACVVIEIALTLTTLGRLTKG